VWYNPLWYEDERHTMASWARLNDLIAHDEKPRYFQAVANDLGVHINTLRRLSRKLGFPPHYVRITRDKPWNHHRVRVLYPTEILLHRLALKPELATFVEVPDGVWSPGPGRSTSEVASVGGVRRGQPSPYSQAVD
jgi:hypothetical protein